MKSLAEYEQAHLWVAAIRLLTHQEKAPPAMETVCQMLSLSREQGGFFCRRLEEVQIIGRVQSPFGMRLFVKDHLKIEELAREIGEDPLDSALKQFQDSRKTFDARVTAVKEEQDARRKDLFAKLDTRLKDSLNQ